jgi:hypothetical protein
MVDCGWKPVDDRPYRLVHEAESRWKHQLNDTTFEKHYTISDLKVHWAMGRETVRRLVMNEPGVVKIRLGKKKANTTYSVPESVARRIHTRLLNAA